MTKDKDGKKLDVLGLVVVFLFSFAKGVAIGLIGASLIVGGCSTMVDMSDPLYKYITIDSWGNWFIAVLVFGGIFAAIETIEAKQEY